MEVMAGAGLLSQEAAGTETFWKSLFKAGQVQVHSWELGSIWVMGKLDRWPTIDLI